MRRLALFVVILAAVGLAGCTSSGEFSQPTSTPSSTAAPFRVRVFLLADITEVQKHAIDTKVRAVPGASDIEFVTREEAYRQFKELFKDRPDLSSIGPDDISESIQFTLADRSAAESAADELRELPGVEQVTAQPVVPPTPTPMNS